VSSFLSKEKFSLLFSFVSFFFRKLQVLDATEGKILRNTPLMIHEKNIHHIITPIPTSHIPLSSHSFNLFLTMSAENLVLLWDLRSFQPVLSFTSHINRRETSLNCAFSPCMKYIAIPSEDRSVRFMDIRKASSDLNPSFHNGNTNELYKVVTGQKDIISTVAYNPLFAQVAIGSYDGSIKFFIDPNQTIYS
jgi:WD40 repeat protein